jgi:LysM repeat protein
LRKNPEAKQTKTNNTSIKDARAPITMNNQSPLIPQGSLLEQKNKGRARVKIAVFSVLIIHGIGLLALLMQGCKKEPDAAATPTPEPANTTPAFVEPSNVTTAATAPGANDPTSTTAAAPASNEPPVTAAQPPVTPSQPPVQPPVISTPGTDYKVAKGDSFSTISKKLHVPVKAITEANPGVDSTKLKIGQTLHIPAAGSATTSAPGTGTGTDAAPGSEQIYTVKSGETLSKIASNHGVSIKALRSANNLKTDKIKVGQKLKIPAKASTPAVTAAVPTPGTESAPVGAGSGR